ncbi:LOW QUALITY PROTEIN: BRD4-interacting chromatin-remodeling complex-associated protein [Osmerus mordax]|uniref:LOW QUALITY PROTEIN: BRD4-interacting chromatin-remodeling complex-associated protein n=1 Tax=Osmerus mordax TaxID=8014 RepID=UPI00350FFF99
MEDEDGTCLLDVLCDPQALNDFLHGTHELQDEDLLLSSSSGEPSLLTDAPSPVSLLAEDSTSQDTPPPGCVDLSFLEEALLASPEPDASPGGVGGAAQAGRAEDEEVACDILQQSLQEADITEQTMALEAGLDPPGEGLSLYAPAPPLLSPPVMPFLPKVVPFPPALPRDTQAAVEPPQPSLLAVGPGCPSLKPTAPQLMGLLPGSVFPAPPPEPSFSLSPVQASSMLLQKALPSLTGRSLIAPSLRTTPGPGILLQRGPLPIQPKLPISIQPRLVQISPKPPGHKPSPGLTFVPGTKSPNILLSPPPGPHPPLQPPPGTQPPKPVSLQLLNQGGSFVLQPQGLFQGQGQFLLPSQAPVTLSQPAGAPRSLLTPGPQGPPIHGVSSSAGHLVDGSQILTVPHRHLNFSPVFTTPSGQLTLRQGALLSGPLQIQPAPPTVFQMPAQLAGAYAPTGQSQRATLVHSPALGNHITLINSSTMLPPDLTSISILNGAPVVQGLPFAAPARRGAVTEAQLSLQQASVVLLPERPALEGRRGTDEQEQQRGQSNRHALQHAAQQSLVPGLQPPSPPVVSLLPAPQGPDPPPVAAPLPKHMLPQSDRKLEEVPLVAQTFIHHILQQKHLCPSPASEAVRAALPLEPEEPEDPHASPVANQTEDPPPTPSLIGEASVALSVLTNQELTGGLSALTHPCGMTSPLGSESQDPAVLCSPLDQALDITPPPSRASPAAGGGSSTPQAQLAEYSSPLALAPSVSGALGQSDPPYVSVEGGGPAVQQHTQNTAISDMEGITFSLEVHLPSPPPQPPRHHLYYPQAQDLQSGMKVPGPAEERWEDILTPAMRRHRLQQQMCLDQEAVHNPAPCMPFSSLEEAVRNLLPYHTCAGLGPAHTPFSSVDEQFDSVSAFLLNRTKDMVNKYRQLLVGEAQQVSPSAEMVMLERLFLQAERLALGEERRRARRDPESFLMDLCAPSSAPPCAYTPSPHAPSDSPPSPPAWMRLSTRPPGLRTYRSSTRGGLRLTIKHESGSRKVVLNSACDPSRRTAPSGLKRDHAGQLTNGSLIVKKQSPHGTNGTPCPLPRAGISNGAPPPNAAEEVGHSVRTEARAQAVPRASPNAPPLSERRTACGAPPPPDSSSPTRKSYKPLPRQPPPEPHPTERPPPEDHMLSEHLQSAIDSILELQRLQGPSAPTARGQPAPALDQGVTSILEGHL